MFWQATAFEIQRSDTFLNHEAAAIAREPMADIARDVTLRFGSDLHRLTFAAVFGSDRAPQVGDVLGFPRSLPPDGDAHEAILSRRFPDGRVATTSVRAVLLPLPDGRWLLIGRSGEAVAELHVALEHALEIGLLPGILLSLAAGTVASLRALTRVRAVNRTVARIMAGDLRERLPTHGTSDSVDRLSRSVNGMLDEIERLLGEVKGVSDSVAHDLRTPLTRVRSRLEGGRMRARSLTELEEVVDHAVADLDQCLAIITALLRIGELEADRRRASFADIQLAPIVQEAADLYTPIADERGILLHADGAADFRVARGPRPAVRGRRQPARQRAQVHACGRSGEPVIDGITGTAGHRGDRHRSGHPGSGTRCCAEAVLQGRPEPPHPGKRPGPEPGRRHIAPA